MNRASHVRLDRHLPGLAADAGKGWLLVKGAEGLGNRMLAAASALLYARLAGRRLVVDWSDSVYSDDGRDFFHTYFDCPSIGTLEEISTGGSVAPQVWRGRLDLSVAELRKRSDLRGTAFRRGSRIDLARLDYPEDVLVFWSPKDRVHCIRAHLPEEVDLPRDELLHAVFAEQLPLHESIRARVERFRAKHLTGRTVGVHVRFSDKRAALDAILAQLDGLLGREPDLGFFLATDNAEIAARFERDYENVCSTPRWYADPGARAHGNAAASSLREHGAEALVDPALLAGSDRLIVDTSSTFGRVASLLSGLPLSRVADVRQSDQHE